MTEYLNNDSDVCDRRVTPETVLWKTYPDRHVAERSGKKVLWGGFEF
jgi:hypothetical protein